MNNIPVKQVAVLAALSLSAVLAQSASSRYLEIQEGPELRGNPRTGPLTFTANPVKASVSTLKIQASQVVLSAPAGTPLPEAKGKRTGEFSGNIQVARGRLSAKGSALTYSEATGLGVLTGNPSATFVPEKKEDGDAVNIAATQMSLDVDNNVSTSTGNVRLTNGEQSGRADKLVFDEDRELAQFTGSPSLTRAAKANQKELIMTGQEVRALTKTKTLYVSGKVKLVQGKRTTTGDAVYYDDKKNVAYVVGNAVTEESGNRQVAPKSGYIEQRTDRGSVRVLNSKFTIPTEQFKLRGEK